MTTSHLSRRIAGVLAASAILTIGLAGCSGSGAGGGGQGGSGTAGAGSSASSGSSVSSGVGGPVTDGGSTAHVDCAAFSTAVKGLFPQGASAPLSGQGTCAWGIGPNATADAAALGQSLTDIFTLGFTYGDDAETQYQGDSGALTGGGSNLVKIPGVGSAAVYYDGGTGVPQVAAWSGKVSCGSHLFLSDATEVGLTSTGDAGRPIAAGDTAALAAKIAHVCAVGWGQS